MNRIAPIWLNCFLLTYLFTMYVLSIALLIQQVWGLNLIGVLLLIHILILSGVLTHELIHGNIFKSRSLNMFFGQLMTHINGACYAPWEDLVEHHFNHHVHHADFVAFDIPMYFKELHPFWQRVCIALEWAYFPVFEFDLRVRTFLQPFQAPNRANQRVRTLVIATYRTALFGILSWLAWKALLLYALAYICFVNLMRFADAFHHTYDYAVVGQVFPKRDRVYEQEHTFSNLVSIKHPWLNLLYLNFGYHNAHHHDMRCPWYALPALHARLYGDTAKHLLPLPKLVANYHQFRLKRLFGDQGSLESEDTRTDIASFTGGIGVSFLTPP